MMDWSCLSSVVGKGEAHRPLRACGHRFLPAYWRSGLKSSEPNVAQRGRYGNEKIVCKRDARIWRGLGAKQAFLAAHSPRSPLAKWAGKAFGLRR